MKNYALLLGVALAVAASAHGQSVRDGAPSALVVNSTLTNVWTAGDSLDLKSYDSVALVMRTTTNQATGLAQIKFQWSNDNTVWADEAVLAAGTAGSVEQPYSALARVVQVPMTNSIVYVERFRRVARYFRPSVSSTNVFTTGRVTVTAQPANNQN